MDADPSLRPRVALPIAPLRRDVSVQRLGPARSISRFNA